MKRIIILLLFVPFIATGQLKEFIKTAKTKVPNITKLATIPDISGGLKEALNTGISRQVSKLTAQDGFFKNELVKILLPSELQKMDKTLRNLGMANLADEGLRVLNRAAEDAVKEATPIFVDAIKNMTFTDAKTILMGSEIAATNYLETATSTALYEKCSPIVTASLEKVNAQKIWGELTSKYNSIPIVKKVTPDLKDYVTKETLKGIFKMIAVEEKEIRVNLAARTSPLLQSIFAIQDKK